MMGSMSAGVALTGCFGMSFFLEAFPAFGLISIMDVGMLLIIDISMFLHVINRSFDIVSVGFVVEHLSLRRPCILSQAEDDSGCCQTHQSNSNSDRQEDISVVVAIRVGIIGVIRIQAANAGCSCDLFSAAGCRTGGERDVEVKISTCDADIRAIWCLIEVVCLFYGDGLAADWCDEVLLSEDAGSVVLSAGVLRKVVRERVKVRFPCHLSTNTWISLVDNRKHEVLAGIVTALHPEIGRTSGHSNLISINETIEVDIDDLLAEVVLNETNKCSEAGVGGYVDYVGGAACYLEQLSCVDICADSHAEEDDSICSCVVGSFND